MISREQLNVYLTELLQPQTFKDYCPNGLQVEGRSDISKIVTGVTACQALLDQAIAQEADAILVHHGYFWKGEPQPITGIKQKRLKKLLTHDVNLFAYHLPLDAHPIYGNNVQLAAHLGIPCSGPIQENGQDSLIFCGEYTNSISMNDFLMNITQKLQRQPLHIAGEAKSVKRVAWCTGGAQGYFSQAMMSGIDCYITGEVSEPSFHLAKESGVHFIAAGHHATERYGIQALGQHLAEKFNLQHQFIDVDNPV